MGDSTSAKIQVHVDEHGPLDAEEAFQQFPKVALSALTNAFVFSPLRPTSLTIIQLLSTFGCAIRASRQRSPYRLQALYQQCLSGSLEEGCIEQRFYQLGGLPALTALCVAASHNRQTGSLLSALSEDEIRDLVYTIKKIEPHRDLRFIIESLERGKTPKPSKKRTTKRLKIPRRHRCSQSSRAIPSAEGAFAISEDRFDSRLFDYPLEDINVWPEFNPLSSGLLE